jgi:hypothetical protein
MIHSEMHTWSLKYCKDTFGASHKALQDEIKLFNQHFPSVAVNADRMGYVIVQHSNKRIAEGAAEQLQNALLRHDWWKEVYV